MQRKICNIIFFFIVAFLIFDNIPNLLRMNLIGGILANKLSFYPFILGFLYTIYCQYKYKNVLVRFDKFQKFILIYVAITFISLIIGLYNYQYYDLVISGPVTQIEKLPKLIELLKGFGINADAKLLTALWMIARVIKGVLSEVIYAFGGAYMIYCWYHDDWQIALKILVKGVLVSLVVVFGYSVIEVFYLAGNETAKNVLEVITPYFHIIKADGTWHPPLLWKNSLRSLFSEASHYGIYFAFAMPILWYVFFEIKKSILKLLILTSITVFTFGLFLTQARTAIALLLGEIFLFAIAILILRNRAIFLKFIAILLCSLFAFGLCNVFISNYLPIKTTSTVKVVNNQVKQNKENNKLKVKNENNKSQTKDKVINKKVFESTNDQKNDKDIINKNQINAYFEKNLFSLASLNKRSNGARYSVMIADFKIGIDHPLLGVGMGLRNAYIPEYLPEMAKDNGEVKMWIKNQKEKGVLRSGFPKLGEYTSRFAETGILGLVVFLTAPIILMRKLYYKITDKESVVNDKIPYVFFAISLIGIMVSGIGDNINITYCYWVLLGLGYAMCFGKTSNKESETKINNE